VLAQAAYKCGGYWFGMWVSVDACMVLAGSVLTAYIGSVGLIRRLALDRSLPQFLLASNAWRGTNHIIIFSFGGCCIGLFVLLRGDVESLASVYAMAFLSVMTLFSLGNMMLKYKRTRLRREVVASWPTVSLAMVSVIIAIVGHVLINPTSLSLFLLYVAAVCVVIFTMFERTRLLKLLVYFIQLGPPWLHNLGQQPTAALEEIRNQPVLFYSKNHNLEVLNKAISYIQRNELSCRIMIGLCVDSVDNPIIPAVVDSLRVLDNCYPKVSFGLVVVLGSFAPGTVRQLSTLLSIPLNFMFLSCPGDRFPHDLGAFGGVRVITH